MNKDWARLARAVAQRRRDLGLSQDAIRQAGGPSDVVIARIENNEEPHPRDDTVNKLDDPLRWEPGSAQQVLGGGDPRVIERVPDLHDVHIDVLLSEIRRRVKDRPDLGAGLPPVVPSQNKGKKFPAAFLGDSGEVTGEDRRRNG